MQTKSTRYNHVGSGILHLLMHNTVAAVSVWRCVNTKSGTFSLRFSAQPLSQNGNFNRFLCYFLCSIWKFWALSELLLTCDQILTTSCEHTRTLPSFSRADIAWTQAQITPSLPIHRPWIWLRWCNFCFFTSVVVIGFNPNTVKLSVLFAKGLCPVTIIGMTKLCK